MNDVKGREVVCLGWPGKTGVLAGDVSRQVLVLSSNVFVSLAIRPARVMSASSVSFTLF